MAATHHARSGHLRNAIELKGVIGLEGDVVGVRMDKLEFDGVSKAFVEGVRGFETA